MKNETIPVLPYFKIEDLPNKAAKAESDHERISAMIKSPEGVALIREIKSKGKNVSSFLETLITLYAKASHDNKAS